MEIGTVLVGVALTAVVVAYLAQPFRVVNIDTNQAIETWVSHAQDEEQGGIGVKVQRDRGVEEINFCPQCGRRAGPDDRFCAGCGKQFH